MTMQTKFAQLLLVGVATFALAACSDKTGESAETTVESAGDDTARNVDAAGNAIENAAEDTGDAMARAGDNAEAAAADAKQNTGEALEEAGKDLQNPK